MNGRKTLIVDRSFQYRFIAKNICFMVLVFILIALVMTVWQRFAVNQGFLFSPPSNAEMLRWAQENNIAVGSPEYVQQYLLSAKPYTFFDLLWKPLLIMFFINVLIIFVENIYFTHKIAGPIHRLKVLLGKKIAGEDVGKISFRKGDMFHDLAELINDALSSDTPGHTPRY